MPDYKVNKSEALRYLGYAGQALDAEMEARIDKNIAACEREARPGFVFRSFPIEACERGVRLVGSSLVLEGADIARHLKGAAECAVLACTLGVANEAAMARRKAQSALDAAIYGAAGSSLVESVADACEAAVVADAAKRGMRTNWRYSPGYGDLPLALQPEIVRVLAADKRLGMVATESNLLIPAKSVTAFVGLFDADANLDEISGVKVVPDLANYPGRVWRGAPCTGQDNDDILSELGFSSETIAEMYERNLLGKKSYKESFAN